MRIDLLLWCGLALAADPEPEPAAEAPEATEATEDDADAEAPEPTVPADEGIAAFADVHAVLTHPRCANCHPGGDVPLQFDAQTPHAMEIDRFSPDKGLPCATCHRPEGLGLPDLPPANPHWGLPPRNQTFQDRTPAELCAQLNDPERTGERSLADLLEHVGHDSLVLWGWDPGPGRAPPPIDHATFVERFTTWVDSGGACPSDD